RSRVPPREARCARSTRPGAPAKRVPDAPTEPVRSPRRPAGPVHCPSSAHAIGSVPLGNARVTRSRWRRPVAGACRALAGRKAAEPVADERELTRLEIAGNDGGRPPGNRLDPIERRAPFVAARIVAEQERVASGEVRIVEADLGPEVLLHGT